MSDSAMPRQPAIELPSNILPSSNSDGSMTDAGKVTCCSMPRISVNRRSMNSTWLSLISFSICSRDIGKNLSKGWQALLKQWPCQAPDLRNLLFSKEVADPGGNCLHLDGANSGSGTMQVQTLPCTML